MQKSIRFEQKYKFSAIYEPPKHIPIISLDPLPGSGDLPCFEGGYLTLRCVREPTLGTPRTSSRSSAGTST